MARVEDFEKVHQGHVVSAWHEKIGTQKRGFDEFWHVKSLYICECGAEAIFYSWLLAYSMHVRRDRPMAVFISDTST